jgi:hypothetical protein
MIGRIFQALVIIWLLSLASGCVSTGNTPSERIVGTWISELGGFPVTVEFAEATVSIGDYDAVAYQIKDGMLILAQAGSQPRTLSFPSADEMIQTDTLTGTEHKYVRVK